MLCIFRTMSVLVDSVLITLDFHFHCTVQYNVVQITLQGLHNQPVPTSHFEPREISGLGTMKKNQTHMLVMEYI